MAKKKTRQAVPSEVRKSWRGVGQKDYEHLCDLYNQLYDSVKRLQAELAECKAKKTELEVMFKDRNEKLNAAIAENQRLRNENRNLKGEVAAAEMKLDCEKAISIALKTFVYDTIVAKTGVWDYDRTISSKIKE